MQARTAQNGRVRRAKRWRRDMDALSLDADEAREGEVDEQDKKRGVPLYARRSRLQNPV